MKCGCKTICDGTEEIKTGFVCRFNDEILLCDDCHFVLDDYCADCQVCIDYWEDKKTELLIEREKNNES